MSDTITIKMSEFLKLQEDSIFLACLWQVGLGSWEGFDAAYMIFKEKVIDSNDQAFRYS
jgi:hypothetical protein